MISEETGRKRAQELRKNATKEENQLWYGFLKTYPVQFRRQVPFGKFIVDFFCFKAKLVIELDGSQHYEKGEKEYDRLRTEYLEKEHGVTVLRFSNLDVLQNFEGVCMAIDLAVKGKVTPSSVTAYAVPPSPGEGICL